MNMYTSVNHMESCREGFTQAMLISKEIGDNLEPFLAGEIRYIFTDKAMCISY